MPSKPHATVIAALLASGCLLGLAACAPEPRADTRRPTPNAAPERASPIPSAEPQPTPPAEPAPPAEPTPPPFDRSAHSIDDPMSLWVVSNKRRPLQPIDFTPSDLVMPQGVGNQNGQPLREPAARATEAFIAGAAEAGHTVQIISAFRDYELQVSLYESYIARDGQLAADTYSARPGHSEHQTGLTVDFDDFAGCMLEPCFGETPAGVWLGEHAASYGFIVRYPEGKQEVTGFMPEPWHFRYVGTELAEEMQRTGVTTLEEFFGLPAAPDYGG